MSEVTAVPLRPIAKGSLVKLWVGVAVVLGVGVGAAYYGTHKQVMAAMSPEDLLASNAKNSGVVTTASGLQYKVIEPGQGPLPSMGDVAKIEYEGRFVNGKIFDASKRHGGAVPMQIGGAIPGFTEALLLMRKGTKLQVWITPALGYGEQGTPDGTIPPRTVLDFDITMVEFVPLAEAQARIGQMSGGHGGM